MNLTIVSDATPDAEPISVDGAKNYLRVDSDLENDIIQGLITAARLEAENEQGRECAQKQFTLALDAFPQTGIGSALGGPFFLEVAAAYGTRAYQFATYNGRISLLDPLVSVDEFIYKDSAGTVHTLTEDVDYIVDTMKHPGIVCPAFGTQWPTADLWPSSAVQITFTAGFKPAACPGTVKQGMSLLVSQWYEGRIPFEAIRFVAELPYSVTSLLRNGKLWRF